MRFQECNLLLRLGLLLARMGILRGERRILQRRYGCIREDIQEDWSGVTFKGQVVPFDGREEVFTFVRSGLSCDEAISSWIANLDTSVTEGENAVCTLKINVRDVPHHGPMIPWTLGKDEDGKPIGMSWKWTGFEPTDDLIAFVRANEAKTWDDFKSAMDNFGVGAQNFVYGDTEGNIGWYPSHRLPIRANIEAGDYTHPPFLPMPGDGSCEWNGLFPGELPQGFNPQGYMVMRTRSHLGLPSMATRSMMGTILGALCGWVPYGAGIKAYR